MTSSKDPDYAFKLEKAIAKKYGEETIVNPASLWDKKKEEKYLQDLKIFYERLSSNQDRVELGGVLVSKKLLTKEHTSTCPVCTKYSPKLNDKLSLVKYNCCYECYSNYVEGREQRWSTGWRPKLKEEEKCL